MHLRRALPLLASLLTLGCPATDSPSRSAAPSRVGSTAPPASFVQSDAVVAAVASHLDAARGHEERGDPAAALAEYDAAIEAAGPARPQLGLQGDLRGAVDAYGEAVRVDPRHRRAHFNRGVDLTTLGEVAAAEEAYTAALDASPTDLGPLVNRAALRHGRGDLPGAIADWREALRCAPPGWPLRTQVEAAIRTAGG